MKAASTALDSVSTPTEIVIAIDNTAATAAIRKGFSSNDTANRELSAIHDASARSGPFCMPLAFRAP